MSGLSKRLFLTLCFLFCRCLTLHADEAPVAIMAAVDKNEIALDEYCNYKIVISSSVSLMNPKIQIPDLEKDFVVLSSSRSQNIAISGGKTRIQIILDYFLKPKKEGKATVGPAGLTYRGKHYASEPIIINTVPAKNPAPEIPQEEESEESAASREKITL
ncbi:hypothetical protein EPN16_08215 [bacterium]|nr:MAG: hypothetical protein EPN16_08215 [bacterium]